MKICPRCGEEKPLEEFHKNKTTKDGVCGICKSCAIASTNDWNAKNAAKVKAYSTDRVFIRHGITQAVYQDLLMVQNGLCAICSESPQKGRLVIDHDHACCPGTYSCGKCIRGLLCNPCNQALGLLKDNRQNLMKALQYLENETSLSSDGR